MKKIEIRIKENKVKGVKGEIQNLYEGLMELSDKINEIIDRLNSQEQPETYTGDDLSCGGTTCQGDVPMTVSKEYLEKTDYQSYPEISVTKVKPEKANEDWRKLRESLRGFLADYSDLDGLTDFVSQLLTKRLFNDEELKFIRSKLDFNCGTGESKVFNSIHGKIGRLLSKEEQKELQEEAVKCLSN